jgi:arylsulfatase A-like enzyme
MKLTYSLLIASLLLIGSHASSQVMKPVAAKPNIIFIMTDDMGFGDLGSFFQNQRAKNNDRSKPWTFTPNLDKMADLGAMLTDHYCAAPVCAPSRASFLTGLSQGHANVRDNQFDKELADTYTIGNVLQKAGYTTAAIGKWGLQGNDKGTKNGNWPAHPLKRGFDYYYGYIRHSDGHEHYPVEGIYRGSKEVWENYREVSKGLDKCYTGDLWTAVAKKWIVDQTKGQSNNQPFLLYLAYDTPHAVLELATQPYPAGGGLSGGLQWIGKPGNMINTASGTPDSWMHPDYANATYDHDNNSATPEIPWPDTYKRYASSTRRIDDAIGDILKLLADLKIDSNTLVVFTSDNGPSIESYLPQTYVPNKANFFSTYGPFDGIKRDVLEGGTRVPTIAWWPGRIPENKIINTPSMSYDWLPTFTEAAGIPAPVTVDGVSLLPSLTGRGKQKESLVYIEYFSRPVSPDYQEFAPVNRKRTRNQMQMIRLGDFIGLRYDVKSADDDFGIFNIKEDKQQANDLSGNGRMAALQKTMKEKVLQVRRVDTSAPRPYDNVFMPASYVRKAKNGVRWKGYNSKSSWLPDVSTLKAVTDGKSSRPDVQQIKKAANDVYVFEGYIRVPEDGEYTFYLTAGSKAFMRIHEAIVIDADYGYVPGTPKESTLKLKAGLHPYTIHYAATPDVKSILDLKWQVPSFSQRAIPATAFFR